MRHLIVFVGLVLFQTSWCSANDLSLDPAHANHSPDYQIYPAFYGGWDAEDSSLCLGASHALHPSVVEFPHGLWGYRFWMAYTLLCVSESDENPHIAVSNDGLQWQPFMSSGDTLFNPVVTTLDLAATHLSDPDLILGPNGYLWLIFRASWELAGLDRHVLYAISTHNGLDWTEPVEVISDSLLGQAQISAFMSPAIIVSEDNGCLLFVVEPLAGGTTYLDISRVVRYTSPDIDGPWVLADTCLFPPSHDSMKIWHLEVLPGENTELLALVTQSPNGRLNFGDSAELYLAVSGDGGGAWTVSGQPILSWVTDTTQWFGRAVYRSSGYWLEEGTNPVLALYYSALSRGLSQGGSGTGWQTGLTYVLFDTSTVPFVAGLSIDGLPSPQHVVNNEPVIRWVYIDPTGASSQVAVEIEVGEDGDWTDAEMWNPPPFETSNANLTYAGTALEDGAIYYLRLRVYNTLQWSDWSETVFRLNTAPTVPIRLSPIDDVVTSGTPTLWIANSVDDEGDSLTYDFICLVDTSFGEPDPMAGSDIPEGSDSTGWQTVEPLHENWRYFWRARSFDGYEYSDGTDPCSSSFWFDEIPEPPSAPQALFPPDTGGMPVYEMLTSFSWSAAFDPDPFDTVRYRLEVASDPVFDSVIVIDSILVPLHVLTDSLDFGIHYWWRVVAFDTEGLMVPSGNSPDFWTWTLGDLDQTHEVNVADLTRLVDYLFLGGVEIYPEITADLDASCNIDIADLTYLVAFLYTGGPAPRVGCE